MQFSQGNANGKRLVDKFKTLQEENEELGKQISEGVIQNYKVEIAELKTQMLELSFELHTAKEENEELKKENAELEATIEAYRKLCKKPEKVEPPAEKAGDEKGLSGGLSPAKMQGLGSGKE